MPMHVTSCASERNLSKFGRLYDELRGRLKIETADKMVFVAQNRNAREVEGTDEDVLANIEQSIQDMELDAQDMPEVVE